MCEDSPVRGCLVRPHDVQPSDLTNIEEQLLAESSQATFHSRFMLLKDRNRMVSQSVHEDWSTISRYGDPSVC